jgi:ferredoxin, 2Fe-2S
MPNIKFFEASGIVHEVGVEEGTSAMQAAVWNNIPGVDGDCGGVAACATCHVHVAAEWRSRVGPASTSEKEMLELAEGVDESSRLGCQIKVFAELDGLVLWLPVSQF